MPELNDIETWTDRLAHSQMRTFTDAEGHFWVEQRSDGGDGYEIAWEFNWRGGERTGRLLIDGEIFSTSSAVRTFLKRLR